MNGKRPGSVSEASRRHPGLNAAKCTGSTNTMKGLEMAG
jgi:hypothetical protein